MTKPDFPPTACPAGLVSAAAVASGTVGHVFVSYSRRDGAYVDRLAEQLTDAGLDVWTDQGIDFGARWPTVIQAQIEDCSAFIPVMSPNSRASEWVQREILFAQQLGKPIFPLLLGGDRFIELIATQDEDVTGERLPSRQYIAKLLAVARLRGALSPPEPAHLPIEPSPPASPAMAAIDNAHDSTVREFPAGPAVALSGVLGGMAFDGTWVTVVKRGFGPSMKGERRVHIGQIAGVNFKTATAMFHGFIQIVVHGETPAKIARFGTGAGRPPMEDPLSTSFSKAHNIVAADLRRAIEEAIAARR